LVTSKHFEGLVMRSKIKLIEQVEQANNSTFQLSNFLVLPFISIEAKKGDQEEPKIDNPNNDRRDNEKPRNPRRESRSIP
jgi:hypothetical protein